MAARCCCREYAGVLRNVDFSEIVQYCGILLKAQQHISVSTSRKPGKSCSIYISADCIIKTVHHGKDPLRCDHSTTPDVRCQTMVSEGGHPVAAILDFWNAILQTTPAMELPLQSHKTCLSGVRSFFRKLLKLCRYLS